jgi:hypothetical protein
MDPYLEAEPFWTDFTHSFISSLANAMLPSLLPRYDVLVEEYIYVAHEEIRLHRVRPDATITAAVPWRPGGAVVAMTDIATEELDYPDFEPVTQRHLKVIHRPTRRVVTVIEMLSPTNKEPGDDGMNAYLEKRVEYLASMCNLVEIDQLRGGERLPMTGPLPPGDYYVYVGRSHRRRPRCQIIGWPWRRELPPVAIPLLPEDQELTVQLQDVFQTAYDQRFYERRLPYAEPLVPPLSPSEGAWANQRLRERGLLT